MVKNKFLTSFICVNSVFLTKCEIITIKKDYIDLGEQNELIYDKDKYIIKIKQERQYKVIKFKEDFKKLTCGNKKIIDVKEVKITGDNIVTSKGKLAKALVSITLELEEEKNYKISFNENNFYDKDYFIGDKLTKLKEELVNLNGKDMSEDELIKKINELKNTYLKKPDSSYYDIINTEKTDKNINITLKSGYFDDIKELLNEQNYVFSLQKPDGYKNAPDYKNDKNKKLYEFLEGTGKNNINKDDYFIYHKLKVNQILGLIIDRLKNKSDYDKNNKVPYNFDIELLDDSNKKIDSSDSILEGGKYFIKIKDLFITEDQNQSVTKLENLIKEIETKSTEDTPFNTSEIGNNYINDKNNEFIDLKNKLKDIEFCKLFLEKNEESFNNYIGKLTNKIKLLGVNEDVKKIINEINQNINKFIEEIKNWQYTNFSDYLDEANKIKNEKVKEYINTLITDAKDKNKGKEAGIIKYYTEDIINNEINNINTSLNARLNELKYSITLVIRGNKKFKNEKNNDKFKDLVNCFNVCYKDYTFNDLLLLIVSSGIFNELDENIKNNTKFYVNNTVITNLKDIITKNSTVEIEFDSSLYKDKNDDKHEREEHNRDTNPQNTDTGNGGNNGNEGNGEEVKKGCCAKKCYGGKKNNK